MTWRMLVLPAVRVVVPSANVPGYCAGVCSGASASDAGNVIGSRPEKFTSPYSNWASAVPCWSPGYHASMTPLTWLNHGIVTAVPVSSTTIVFGLAAATAEISASPLPSSDNAVRSAPSP